VRVLRLRAGDRRAEQDERARRSRRLLEAEVPEVLARLDAAGDPEPRAKLPGPVPLAIGWFPADQWPEAIGRWSDLLDDLPADPLAYNQPTEARIKRIARHLPGQATGCTSRRVEHRVEDTADIRCVTNVERSL
jgi:hypothetical protein